MKTKCCVPNCDSRRKSVKLHRFPKTEIGLKWVKYIKCAKLKELSAEERHKYFVCHRHFEQRFVNRTFRLQIKAYPTLFTQQEMKTGIPINLIANALEDNVRLDHDYALNSRKRRREDHTYCKTYQKEDEELAQGGIESAHTIKIEHKLISDCDNLPSTSKLSKALTQNPDIQHHDQAEELPKVDDKFIGDDMVTQQCTSVMSTPKKRRFVIRKKDLTPRCYRILKEYKKAKKQLNFATRARRAIRFTKNGNLEKILKNLNPLAKKIILMQINQCNKKTKGRRFTDEEKIISLAIMKQSPKTYKFLRKIFILPSTRTVNKMMSKLHVESGLNPQISQAIKTEVEHWEESKRYCSLMFDEVALEPGLVYNKHKDNIYGFVELEKKTTNFADHALVFMLRGALHKWQQPICFYLCEGATSAQVLKNILKDVVTEINKTGLIPVALICDQGTAFQSAIKKLQEETRRQQILAEQHNDDTIEIDGAKLNVIYDPPHLIKGLRNNFLTKNIKHNEKVSKWSDIVDVYLTDCKHTEMRLLHKLNDEHVIPEKIKKMKVRNCTRVLSKTVASALNYTSQFLHYVDGRKVSKTLKNTAETVSFFDEVFDSCNGASFETGKPLRQPVTKKSMHHGFWKAAIKKFEEIKFLSQDGKEVMVPSQKNFITTIKSLDRLWQLFNAKGYKVMRPRYFNSDPIENFFGQMRAYSFRNNDPNCHAFQHIFRSLLITRFINFHSESYNCEKTSGDHILKLKNLFHVVDNYSQMPVASAQNTLEISPEETKNIQTEARQERLNMHSRAYTAGWVVRKCLNKIKCEICKKSLTQSQTSVHDWVRKKEFKNDLKLTYPSENAVRCFSEIVKESNKYLETNPNDNNISNKISNQIQTRYLFDFLKCQMHKEILSEYFLFLTIKLTVINWCSTINKILKGVDVSRLKHRLPKMQDLALKKFNKKLKNKKIHK